MFSDPLYPNVNGFLMPSPSTKAHSMIEAKEDLEFKPCILYLNNNTKIKCDLMGEYPKLYNEQNLFSTIKCFIISLVAPSLLLLLLTFK